MSQRNSKRYKPETVKAVLGQLSELCDPLALMAWIDKKTKYGERAGPSPWHYTECFLADYDLTHELGRVKDAFAQVGVTDELDASVWLAEHLDHIP
jgi:hypothetical protein